MPDEQAPSDAPSRPSPRAPDDAAASDARPRPRTGAPDEPPSRDGPVAPDPHVPVGRRPPPSEHASQHSVLDLVAARTGESAKLLLSDSPSELGPSPVISAAPAGERQVPPGGAGYQVLGEIARGGMGAILKGHDPELGRDVAIKVLLEKHASNPAILQRFVEEAQIGGQLQHPGIVPVYELGLMADQRPYFTMKLVKGRTLAALLAERKDVSEGRRRFLAIFEQVCQTMAYAHSRKVVHRDLKPANIMVGAFGEVQIVDWGLSKVIREGGVSDERAARQSQVSIIETVRSGPGSSGSDSLAGSVMGTPAYMSPEQAQGEIDRLDERTDVFALGAILCEILTGQPPYTGANDRIVMEAAQAKLDDARQRLADCGADEPLVEIARQCLTPSRAARPRNAEALATALAGYLAGVEERAHEARVAAAEARVKAEQERRARRLTAALAGSVLVTLLLAGAGYLWWEHEQAGRADAARALVDASLAEALPLQADERWDEALAATERARLVAAGPDVDAATRERVAAFEARLHEGVERARQEAEREAANQAFVARLEQFRFNDRDLPTRAENEQYDADYAQAFADEGLDLFGPSVDEAAAAVRATGIAVPIAQALDAWARLKVQLDGFGTPDLERLTHVAMAADPDPWRTRLRQAFLADDAELLRELARSDDLLEQPPETIVMLALTLFYMGHKPELRPLLRTAQARYPSDFGMNLFLGLNLLNGTPGRPEEAAHYLMAAHVLRPGNIAAVSRLRTALVRVEDWESARSVTEDLLELEPDNWGANNDIAWRLANGLDGDSDPVRAVELARTAVENAPPAAQANAMNTLGVALYRAGEVEAAISFLAQSAKALPDIPENWIFLAMANARLGQQAEAEQCLEQARQRMAGAEADDPDRARFLQEAADLVGRGGR